MKITITISVILGILFITLLNLIAPKAEYNMKLTCNDKIIFLCNNCYDRGARNTIYLSNRGVYVMNDSIYNPIAGETCKLLTTRAKEDL